MCVASPGSGLDKRQASLQVAFTPTGNNIRIDIVFRGTGKQITKAERKAYDKDVDVFFQKVLLSSKITNI